MKIDMMSKQIEIEMRFVTFCKHPGITQKIGQSMENHIKTPFLVRPMARVYIN
jgi:hypothetical protein